MPKGYQLRFNYRAGPVQGRTGAGEEKLSAYESSVRAFCEHLRPEFVETFGLPLSVMIATKSEWSGIDSVVVRERAALT